MDKTRTTLTKPSAVREVVYSRSRTSRKGIPGKNRQKKEARQNSGIFLVRGGEPLKVQQCQVMEIQAVLGRVVDFPEES